jgi:hypothetical protein
MKSLALINVALRVLEWVNFTFGHRSDPGNYAENALSFVKKTGHDQAMDIPRHLRDVYRFPGLVPAASVRQYPGDSAAIILPLHHRRKKQSVASADRCIAFFTISGRV